MRIQDLLMGVSCLFQDLGPEQRIVRVPPEPYALRIFEGAAKDYYSYLFGDEFIKTEISCSGVNVHLKAGSGVLLKDGTPEVEYEFVGLLAQYVHMVLDRSFVLDNIEDPDHDKKCADMLSKFEQSEPVFTKHKSKLAIGRVFAEGIVQCVTSFCIDLKKSFTNQPSDKRNAFSDFLLSFEMILAALPISIRFDTHSDKDAGEEIITFEINDGFITAVDGYFSVNIEEVSL